ncbi:MAG: hypothetical protein K2Y18_02315 [Alphaproteobacteria bacterium]|jgi:hypothetical protein|nr:hypothetical protein [Alphaproteobacteria bacterium]
MISRGNLVVCLIFIGLTTLDTYASENVHETQARTIVSYCPAPVKVIHHGSVPIEISSNDSKSGATSSTQLPQVVEMSLDHYQKTAFPEKLNPEDPVPNRSLFLDLPKDLIKIIARESGNIVNLRETCWFLHDFGYGVVKSFPFNFCRTATWREVKAGRNPFPDATQIEELHLYQLYVGDLEKMGFVEERWESSDVPSILLSHIFVNVKRLVMSSTERKMPSKTKELMKERGITTRKLDIPDYGFLIDTFMKVRHLQIIDPFLTTRYFCKHRNFIKVWEKVHAQPQDNYGMMSLEERLIALKIFYGKFRDSLYGNYFIATQPEAIAYFFRLVFDKPDIVAFLETLQSSGACTGSYLFGYIETYLPLNQVSASITPNEMFNILSSIHHRDTSQIVKTLQVYLDTYLPLKAYATRYYYVHGHLVLLDVSHELLREIHEARNIVFQGFIQGLANYQSEYQLVILARLLPLINVKSIYRARAKFKTNPRKSLSVLIAYGLETSRLLFSGLKKEKYSRFVAEYRKQKLDLNPLEGGTRQPLAELLREVR